MTVDPETLVVIVSADTAIDDVVRLMAERSKQVAYAGVAVVVDKDNVVEGVLSDGDVRRALSAKVDFSGPVSSVMVKDPVTVDAALPLEDVAGEVFRQADGKDRLTTGAVPHILVTDSQNRLVNVYPFSRLFQSQDAPAGDIVIFGMGFVGLTLAVSFAIRGEKVTGVEIDPDILSDLLKGKAHFREPGLDEMLRLSLDSGNIRFIKKPDGIRSGTYIVTVGSPLTADGEPDLAALEAVGREIGKSLNPGDLVMLRSTVPSGTTRGFFLPLLEELSGLEAGRDFHLSFAPERTIEGRALKELSSLPQVVGGFSPVCTERAAHFWRTLTPSVVQAKSLEAAEIIKLANNTFRDISFAFANEIALLADRYNLDAFELIRAANEGYPRNSLPPPSPGVGGACLTKDPVLFSKPTGSEELSGSLGTTGRAINEKAGLYPLDMTGRFLTKGNLDWTGLRVLIVGIAFKGEPETDDIRGSVALKVIEALQDKGADISGWDAVVPEDVIAATGITAAGDLGAAVGRSQVVLILNSHSDNVKIAPHLLTGAGAPRLVFDGWSILEMVEVERIPGCHYATMGYLSAKPFTLKAG